METKFIMLVPSFYDDMNISVAIIKEITIDGETHKSQPWRKAFNKGDPLIDTLPTPWGNLPWSDFTAERDYILAKWAE